MEKVTDEQCNKPVGAQSPASSADSAALGVVGIPAAIANAVFHATGKRIRDLRITLDKRL